MTIPPFLTKTVAATLLAPAALALALAAISGPAVAAGNASSATAPTSPDQPVPRTGGYRIVSTGKKVVHAKCAEGGNVVVPLHDAVSNKRRTTAERDAAIRDACKSVDYSK